MAWRGRIHTSVQAIRFITHENAIAETTGIVQWYAKWFPLTKALNSTTPFMLRDRLPDGMFDLNVDTYCVPRESSEKTPMSKALMTVDFRTNYFDEVGKRTLEAALADVPFVVVGPDLVTVSLDGRTSLEDVDWTLRKIVEASDAVTDGINHKEPTNMLPALSL